MKGFNEEDFLGLVEPEEDGPLLKTETYYCNWCSKSFNEADESEDDHFARLHYEGDEGAAVQEAIAERWLDKERGK